MARADRGRGAIVVALAVATLLVAGCGRDAANPASPPPGIPAHPASATATDARATAHRALAERVRPALIRRGGATRDRRATADERTRLGAFWLARTDLHHFDAAFRQQAGAILAVAGDTPAADAALQRLLAQLDRHLPAWRALHDYNAAGTLQVDFGIEGRRRLPQYVAAIDAIEAAAYAYLDVVDRGMRTE